EEREERESAVPASARIRVEPSEYVRAGQQLTDGPLDPQKILLILGPEAVQLYLVEEVQKVYRSQGVNINDKHLETIIRQMMRKVIIDSPGDTAMLPGEYIDRFEYEEANAKVFAEGGEPDMATPPEAHTPRAPRERRRAPHRESSAEDNREKCSKENKRGRTSQLTRKRTLRCSRAVAVPWSRRKAATASGDPDVGEKAIDI